MTLPLVRMNVYVEKQVIFRNGLTAFAERLNIPVHDDVKVPILVIYVEKDFTLLNLSRLQISS
jgi:hypothetical protein